MRQVGLAAFVGVIVGSAAVQLHASELTGGTQTATGWALGWHVLLVAIAVGLGGGLFATPRQTALLALLTASVVAALHIYRGVRLPGYEVGAAIVGADVRDDVHGQSRQCAALHFIGVRGSGETSRDGGGFGTVVQAFRLALVGELANPDEVDSTPIDYPSAGVATLAYDANRFFSSFEVGADELTAEVRRSLGECPHRRMILVGHSQGAAVVHMSLAALAPAERGAIAQVVLFSDPGREASNDFNRGFLGGLDGSFVEGGGARLPGLPPSVPVQSWCFEGDLVCSWDWNPVTIARFVAGSKPHHSDPYLAIVADVAAELAPLLS